MDSHIDRQDWLAWANWLRRLGLDGWAAAILESAGPLTTLGAQALYLSQPVLQIAIPAGRLDALARALEDTRQTQAFVRLLREETEA